MRHKWQIEKEDFRESLLYELKEEKCSKEDEKLAKEVISYLVTFLPLNYNPGKKLEVVPTLAGLSLYTGVPKEELEKKGKNSKTFKKLYGYLFAVQEARVLALSLKGQVNFRIASLVLFNHGYKAKKTKEDFVAPEGSVELSIKFEGAEYEPLIKINPQHIEKKLKKLPPIRVNDLLEKEISQIKQAKYEKNK